MRKYRIVLTLPDGRKATRHVRAEGFFDAGEQAKAISSVLAQGKATSFVVYEMGNVGRRR